MLLLVDGYNVVSPAAAPARGADDWLHRERTRLLDRLASQLDRSVRARCCVVFDAANPPPGRPNRFTHQSIDVRFAVGYPEADDLIEEIIAIQSAPKRLAVISSDHRIQAAAARRSAMAFDAEPWLDDLIDGRVRLAHKVVRTGQDDGAGQGSVDDDKPEGVSPDDARKWLEDFGLDP